MQFPEKVSNPNYIVGDPFLLNLDLVEILSYVQKNNQLTSTTAF